MELRTAEFSSAAAEQLTCGQDVQWRPVTVSSVRFSNINLSLQALCPQTDYYPAAFAPSHFGNPMKPTPNAAFSTMANTLYFGLATL